MFLSCTENVVEGGGMNLPGAPNYVLVCRSSMQYFKVISGRGIHLEWFIHFDYHQAYQEL